MTISNIDRYRTIDTWQYEYAYGSSKSGPCYCTGTRTHTSIILEYLCEYEYSYRTVHIVRIVRPARDRTVRVLYGTGTVPYDLAPALPGLAGE